MRTPYLSRTRRRASRVVLAPSGSELTVIASTSMTISFGKIPYLAASAMIFPAIFALPSASAGIPASSRVSPTTTPPYFFTRGKTWSMDSCLPLTELIIGLPLYIRMAASMAEGSTVSICRGRLVMLCSSPTTSCIMDFSSISGSPTFTSRMWAPFSCWVTASFRMYSISWSFRACRNFFFPVGLMRSPMMTGLSPRSTARP